MFGGFRRNESPGGQCRPHPPPIRQIPRWTNDSKPGRHGKTPIALPTGKPNRHPPQPYRFGLLSQKDVPQWYDALDEKGRWDTHATFWKTIAREIKEEPIVFCLDLMNEPVVTGENANRAIGLVPPLPANILSNTSRWIRPIGPGLKSPRPGLISL